MTHQPRFPSLALGAVLLASLAATGCDRQEERLDRAQDIAQGVGDQLSGREETSSTQETGDERD